ncbi:MAG: hypothetical protein ACT6SF_10045 [Hydrogenophaga sp.]|jgi:hypothetical protein|uniref:hypothetical protein n=1 Tax=Hydrogenophaga sp. TaxID=1904254 RepID=UPI001D40E420|nr:hypothetical protein [Hydrogenophaga sp.]MBW0171608.1 hypothetical protein [Hydrogenophaga sp.]MBW0184182.1 hypothetical protein [Hydrogenophaga sp.]
MLSNNAFRLALALITVWLIACLFGPALLSAAGADVNVHGHAHLYAHGHPFADARTLWGIPNAMDVLSNLPLTIVGLCGSWALRRVWLGAHTRRPLQVFFAGLLVTSVGSAWYHWAPDPFGLALDRMGMAITFAGAIALTVAERGGPRTAAIALGLALVMASISAWLPLTHDNVLPWVIVQFGGMALIVAMAWRAPRPDALGVHLGALVGIYALAKLFELGDEAVFHLTSGTVSGHSLKHLVAALAAWPVWRALRQNPRAADRATALAAS